MNLSTPSLTSARLRLRPFTIDDRDTIFALLSDAHVLRYWDAPPWSEVGRADVFLAACRSMAEDGTGIRVAVDATESGEFLGWCTLSQWSSAHRTAGLGFCFTEESWGQGIATEAAAALLTWAFTTTNLRRIHAQADTRNVASARVLEKLGFTAEGTLREDCLVDGVVSSTRIFGLLKLEWHERSR